MSDKIPASYLTDEALYHSPVFRLSMLWRPEASIRWPYVNRFERAVMESVCLQMGWELISLTQGFDPTMDAIVRTQFGLVDFEIKTTSKHSGYVEAAQPEECKQSGLSATKANFYMHISVDRPWGTDILSTYRKMKVRIYPVWLIQSDFAEAYRVGTYKASKGTAFGPGTIGFDIDSFKTDHCWVGDMLGQTNKLGDVLIMPDTWTTANKQALLQFKCLMPGVIENDTCYREKYLSKDAA